MKNTTTSSFRLFLLVFGIVVITSETSQCQSWTISGDTISSSGTVKATSLNVTGPCVKMPGLVSDTGTTILGLTGTGKVISLTGYSSYPAIYPTMEPGLPSCDTAYPMWYKQVPNYPLYDNYLVTKVCTWVGIGEAGVSGLPDAPLSISSSNSTIQFSVVNPTSSTDVATIDKNGNTYLAGNVGIGASSVNSQFNIYSSFGYPSAFTINNPSGNVFRITDYGNVLIQTTNNFYALNVGGTIWAKSVRVCMSACDYVFDKDYKLMPLNELENYLKLNHHLPGIASAKEMETSDGVELGKMNSKLLQKVEELTLYTIQLKKQLDEMQAEMARLKESK